MNLVMNTRGTGFYRIGMLDDRISTGNGTLLLGRQRIARVREATEEGEADEHALF
jgi:hypothetical protein